MPPPSPKAKMLESSRIPDGEGMPSPYNTTIRYATKHPFIPQNEVIIMEKRRLWLIWYTLFIVCALLGFIPEPRGFWKFLLVCVSIGFFVPGFCLLKWADNRSDRQTLTIVRWIAFGSLCATVFLVILNGFSVMMSELWGDILYGLLVVVSSPMVCGQYWFLSLFGWACMMLTAHTMLKKK